MAVFDLRNPAVEVVVVNINPVSACNVYRIGALQLHIGCNPEYFGRPGTVDTSDRGAIVPRASTLNDNPVA